MTFRQAMASILWGLFLIPGTAYADQLTNKLESLVMPGPLSIAHEKYKEQCTKCHSPLDQTRQNTLCIDCHKNVEQDIKKAAGFHGRSPQVSGSECSSCHTDHEGRDMDILGFNRETFNHKMTDFILTGKHTSVSCNECHVKDKKLHEAKTDCFSCHEDDDSHEGDMGRECESCHTSDIWQKVKFDHSKTKFPLKGKHEKVECKSCHPDPRYKKTPSTCVDCHGGNDDHEGRFGQKCESCHETEDWKKAKFNHAKDAKFLLKGKHENLACEACHTSLSPKQENSKKCNDCHAPVDVHKGRNGLKCETCHSETSWTKSSFSHDKDTKFPLNGAHKDVECFTCHRGEKKKAEKLRICIDCHTPDDVHEGQLGKDCRSCHGQTKWLEKVKFDHDLTLFPLNGMHAITACDECHITSEYKNAKVACASCHEADDIHKQALGQDCATCHNPNGWAFWQFDHDQQTKYDLDGAHAGLACNACHKNPVKGKIKLEKECADCHRSDDIHQGRFGTMCKRCHITESFKTIRIGR